MTTDYPRVGDRVKVTYEGTVTNASDVLRRYFELDGAFQLATEQVASIEVVDPKPFPAGTVVRSKAFPSLYHYVRTESGYYDVFGRVHFEHPLRLERDVEYGTLEVVYEPPSA